MVVEHYMDLQDDTGQIDMTGLRCTSCGEVVDAVILENRVRPAPNLLYGTKQRNYAQRMHEGELGSSNERAGKGDEAARER
jgi:hypothetical protein